MPQKQKNNTKVYEQLSDFIYETSVHSKTPRSGLWLLGTGEQSVAEHLFHTAMIAYALAYFEPTVDREKLILMALFHDIGEGRVSDHNHLNQRYGRLAEAEAVKDISEGVPFGKEILALFEEEQERMTLEARLVKDADVLEWICTLRDEEAKGNVKAKKWITSAKGRLKTDAAKKVLAVMLKTHPDKWFMGKQQATPAKKLER